MGEEIYNSLPPGHDHPLHVASFWGGDERGKCLQFTPAHSGYAQLSRTQVEHLRTALDEWLRETK